MKQQSPVSQLFRTRSSRYGRFALLTLGLSSLTAWAEPIEFSGTTSLETRAFWQGPAYAEQGRGGVASISAQPEWRWRSEDRSQRVNVLLFGRYDGDDSERTHLDVREAYSSWEADDWDLTIGANKVFWGVTESVHLVDVINQTDLVEDPDQEQKLGQPMVNLNLQRDWGRIGLYWLPYFRERTFPGADGRLRPPVAVGNSQVSYESGAEEYHHDFALRYSHYVGDVDFGAYVFRGTNREALLLPAADGQSLRPHYEQMNQLGVDLQYTANAWLWKLEAIYRDTRNDQFAAFVGGFEYSFYQLGDSAMDLGALLEYQYDNRAQNSSPTLADDDVFTGVRLAFNDAADTAILAGVSVDTNDGATVFNLEAERRLSDSLFASLRLRSFAGAAPENPAYAFRQDDYLQLQLDWRY